MSMFKGNEKLNNIIKFNDIPKQKHKFEIQLFDVYSNEKTRDALVNSCDPGILTEINKVSELDITTEERTEILLDIEARAIDTIASQISDLKLQVVLKRNNGIETKASRSKLGLNDSKIIIARELISCDLEIIKLEAQLSALESILTNNKNLSTHDRELAIERRNKINHNLKKSYLSFDIFVDCIQDYPTSDIRRAQLASMTILSLIEI